MAQRSQLTCPVVCRCTCLHADPTGRKLGKERQHLTPREPLSQHNGTVGVDAVYLEDVLGQIETDSGNLHDGRLLSCVAINDDHVRAPRCRGAGAVHPISKMVMVADVVVPVGNAAALSTGVAHAALRIASFFSSRR
jgi:hypothetical protein